MKTPDYTKKAQKAYRQRLRKKGYKYWSVLAPVDIIQSLKEFYKRLINK